MQVPHRTICALLFLLVAPSRMQGPLAANGDLGVVVGGPPGTALGPPGGKPGFGGSPGSLGLYLGKNDFWGWPDAVTYHASFQHFSPG
jgi:hypothetical protein